MTDLVFQELEKKERKFCSWCNDFFEPRSDGEFACQECIKEEVEQLDSEEFEETIGRQYAFEDLAHELMIA